MVSLESVSARQVYFEQTITRLLSYWLEHEAVQEVKLELLDAERDNILNAIMLSLEMPTVWLLTKDLIESFHKYMIRRGFTEVWQGGLGKAIDVARTQEDIDAETMLTALLAANYLGASNYKEAVRAYRRVIRLARVSGNLFEEARACTNLGSHLIDQGFWRRSEVLCSHGLKIFEDLGHQQGIAHSHRDLGFLYVRQEKWQDAEGHLKKACHMWEELQDDYKLMYGYQNLAVLYLEMNQAEPAFPYINKALNKAKSSGGDAFLSALYMTLGVAHLLQEDFSLAEQHLKESEKIAQMYNDSFVLAQVVRHIGDVYEARKDYARACEYFELSAKRFRDMGNWNIEIEALGSLAECQILSDDFDKALKTLKRIEALLVKFDAKQREYYGRGLAEAYDSLREKGILTSSLDKWTRAFDEM